MNWRTAMSYDATLAIAKGLTLDKTRSGLQKELIRNGFKASGATGDVEFSSSGDRKPIPGRGGMGILVKVEPKTGNEYKFSPIP